MEFCFWNLKRRGTFITFVDNIFLELNLMVSTETMSMVATPLQPATSNTGIPETQNSGRMPEESPRDRNSTGDSNRRKHPKVDTPAPSVVGIPSRVLARQSTVPEVTKDSSGYTWEIYGAEIDPESLREAIEKHKLRLQTKQCKAQRTNPPPTIQRSATIRDNLWEPVRKLFMSKNRSATTDATCGTGLGSSTDETTEKVTSEPTGKTTKSDQKKLQRLPTTEEVSEDN